MKRKRALLCIMAASLCLLSGCVGKDKEPAADNDVSQEQTGEDNADDTEESQDDYGLEEEEVFE